MGANPLHKALAHLPSYKHKGNHLYGGKRYEC